MKIGKPIIISPYNGMSDIGSGDPLYLGNFAPVIHQSSTPSFPVDPCLYSKNAACAQDRDDPLYPIDQNDMGNQLGGTGVKPTTFQTFSSNPATVTNDVDAVINSITNKIKANPLGALAVVGLLGYFAFKGGKK